MDLNQLKIANADGPSTNLRDFSVSDESSQVDVFFRNLETELVSRISEADIVVGCVAWLTSRKILDVLAKRHAVSLVVQKEDFLRPDLGNSRDWKKYLRTLYSKLPDKLSRYDEGFAGTALHMMSRGGDPSIDAVRCVGNHNSQKSSAFPRMHNKFIIFCREVKSFNMDVQDYNFEPYEVWTGSFNFTKNAVSSFENAVVLRDKRLVDAYFQEYAQIAALSEPLDWQSEWIEPEWRIGT